MAERITEADCRILSKYQEAGQGAWTTMPQEDKAAYRRIHDTLDQLIQETLATTPYRANLNHSLTMGFSPKGGVRGNRPKDLWCAVFPRDVAAYMPQVYLIVSTRGVELGFAAAIHPSDFSDAAFKAKLKELAPKIFDATTSANAAAKSTPSSSAGVQ